MPPLLNEEEMDMMDSGVESYHDIISTEMLEDICDESQSHPNINRREACYKVHDIIRQTKSDRRTALKATQFADPGVGDNGDQKLCRLLSRRFIRSTIVALCLVCLFGARTYDNRSVVVNVCIVGPNSCRIREHLAVASNVSSLRPNKADEVVDRSRFVIGDLKEETSNGLSKSREVGVGWLSIDGIEVVEGVGGFFHNLLGSHTVPAKMAGPSY